ncbi:adenosylcobinamide amidohydrolase [Actinomadura gamaensis]|uniref:Adenosylcobinamide amidohydrolase n=1 Tax=Actinomadura gamaensis TaxID=1763541 RepID=A0ABV9U0F7_9ACTN
MIVDLHWREEDGARLAATVWRPGDGYRTISSAMLGGGLTSARWVLNAQVAGAYSRMDPVEHLHELAAAYGLEGPGVGMLTAASVERTQRAEDGGVEVSATVGLRVPTWAAAPVGADDPELAPIRLDGAVLRPGTINIVVSVPVPLSDAALVNAVMTVTEAKSQAMLEAGYAGTGTASDAVCVAAPETPGEPEPFAGPRSEWGARIARAVHRAVLAGAHDYTRLLAARRGR